MNVSAIRIFIEIERFCTFFSSSNLRWEVLSSHGKVLIECLVINRWSTHYEAIRAVKTEFQWIFKGFDLFRKSSHEKGCTNHFAFNWKLLLHVTFILLGRNSGTNKSQLSEFLRRSLMIFIIQGFWTIVFIFIVIFTTFRPLCLPAFLGCFLSNSGAYADFRTTSFI